MSNDQLVRPDRSECLVSQRRKRHGRRRPSTTVAPKSQPGERPIKKRYPGLSAFPGRLHRDYGNSGTSRHSMTFPGTATAIATIIAAVIAPMVPSGQEIAYRTVTFVGSALANSDFDIVNPNVAFCLAAMVPFHEALVMT